MSYTVVDTIIKSELDIVARKDGRSKNLYMRKRNANGKAIYTYISLKTKDKVDAKKLARKLFEENIRGAVTFANDTIGFVDYATKAKDNFDYRYKNGLISEQHADLSKRLIDRYAISFFGSMQLQNIKSKTLMNFVNHCHKLNADNSQLSLSKRTIEKIRDAVVAVFKIAEREDENFIAPKFDKDLLIGSESSSRALFEQTEIVTMLKRAKNDYESLVAENKKDKSKFTHLHTYNVKKRTFVFDADSKQIKLKYESSKLYTAYELFNFYNYVLFAVNSYVRSSEWKDIKIKHCTLRNMTAEEIKRLSEKAKKALQKRDAKYAKYELAEVYIVNAKVKKTRNTKRVFYRGAVDCIKRLTSTYKLKENDFLFLNEFENRKYAHRKMSNLFNDFCKHYNCKYSKQNEERTLYSFRHSGITMSLNAGIDSLLLANNAGTSVKMIENFYASRIQNTATAPLLI